MIGEIWTYKATKPSDNLEKIRPVLVIGDDGDNGLEFVDINYAIISSSASCGKYDVEINEEIFKGMTSVGNNPTVNGIDLTIETYILDFNENIYNKEIKLYFIDKIRDEIKFNNIDELVNQLKKDKKYVETKNIAICQKNL